MSTVNQDCTKIRQHLALYAGRDLEESVCVQVEQHLSGCGACRAELGKTFAARERIAVLGAETQRGLESAALWPAVREAWLREREIERTEVASLDLSRPRAKRRLLPLSLAAAAAVAAFWLGSHWHLFPGEPAENVVVDDGASPPRQGDIAITPQGAAVQPVGTGSLRRAEPGEERLRDSSLPLEFAPHAWRTRGDPRAPNALAGDDGLR